MGYLLVARRLWRYEKDGAQKTSEREPVLEYGLRRPFTSKPKSVGQCAHYLDFYVGLLYAALKLVWELSKGS